jgi:hypothetical protein
VVNDGVNDPCRISQTKLKKMLRQGTELKMVQARKKSEDVHACTFVLSNPFEFIIFSFNSPTPF